MAQPSVVKAIIHDQEGRFLLQHRDNFPGIAEPDCWSFFGGGVEEGETLAAALERELLEELSCNVGQIGKELFRWNSAKGASHVCFEVSLTASKEELILTEGQGFAWFFLDEFSSLTLSSLVRANLSQLSLFASNKWTAPPLESTPDL